MTSELNTNISPSVSLRIVLAKPMGPAKNFKFYSTSNIYFKEDFIFLLNKKFRLDN